MKIVENIYVNALLILMLFSAVVQTLVLFSISISNGDLYIFNYFNILDLDILFPLIFKNDFLGNFASLIIIIATYFIILKSNKSE
jgi:hypothetical protein